MEMAYFPFPTNFIFIVLLILINAIFFCARRYYENLLDCEINKGNSFNSMLTVIHFLIVFYCLVLGVCHTTNKTIIIKK